MKSYWTFVAELFLIETAIRKKIKVSNCNSLLEEVWHLWGGGLHSSTETRVIGVLVWNVFKKTNKQEDKKKNKPQVVTHFDPGVPRTVYLY